MALNTRRRTAAILSAQARGLTLSSESRQHLGRVFGGAIRHQRLGHHISDKVREQLTQIGQFFKPPAVPKADKVPVRFVIGIDYAKAGKDLHFEAYYIGDESEESRFDINIQKFLDSIPDARIRKAFEAVGYRIGREPAPGATLGHAAVTGATDRRFHGLARLWRRAME